MNIINNKMESKMKKVSAMFVTLMLMAGIVSCSKEKAKEEPKGISSTAEKGDTGYTYKISVENITFNWKAGKNLAVKIKAKTTGWIGIGFNPSEGMKDANFIMGYVKDGKVTISNQHGTSKSLHKSNVDLGGKENVTAKAGSEKNGETELSFEIPFKTGDKLDRPVDLNGDTTILLAYGQSDLLAQQHMSRAKIKVNLSNGSYSVISVVKDTK